MTQPTTTGLVTTLADALGVPRRIVESTARHLREAGLLPTGKGSTAAPASIEHAVALLIGLMLAPGSKAAGDMARLYTQLPLDGVNFGLSTASCFPMRLSSMTRRACGSISTP